MELNQCRINLSSGQVPTTPASTLCQPLSTQPPAHPGWHHRACCQPAACQPAAHLLAPWVPADCQPSTWDPYLAARPKFKNTTTSPEEGGNNESQFKNKFTTKQWGARSQTTWAESNSSQTNDARTKVDHESNLTPIVMNDISILVLKTWELKPGSQGKPYVDQSGQETAQLLAGSSPGPPEIDDPKQGEQKPANLPSVNTGGSKSTLETLESNPDPPKTT
ncbi:hypothetical protein DSO57_1013919 [Entomophthora muscae]|uniref:Uncharacterized protein n=1 Tax=Entomophthora muscae TaxID=34485 RepID=A0ACC2URC3_9FUNG|nr:hypothetical protein DSO57_1013919 [Entomophthora muscae]